MSNESNPLVKRCISILQYAYISTNTPIDFSKDYDEFWQAIDKIKENRSDALALAQDNISDKATVKRLFGIYLYGEIFNPTEDKDRQEALIMINLLSLMIATEKDVSCLIAIANALGSPYMHEAEKALLTLSNNDVDDVRFAATRSLGSTSINSLTSEWIIQMIVLAQDNDDDIREWATMHLSGVEEDEPRIISALLEKLNDPSVEVRTEAINGLANKGDTRGLPALKLILDQGPADRKDFESAGLYGLPELLPLLDGFHTKDHLLDWARNRCSDDLAIKNSVDDEWLGDEVYEMVYRGKRRPIKYKEWGGTGSPWNN